MAKKFQRIAFLFPGQGAQYPGMAGDFVRNFSAARLAFEEADAILQRPLSSIILEGPEAALVETRNSQAGIFTASTAIFRAVAEALDQEPYVCAGLSLGEYTALTAAGCLSFADALPLIELRGRFMNEACESTPGAMAAVIGLDADAVEEVVREACLPHDLWIANFNCPGQVIISGTKRGIEEGTALLKERKAKRILPLSVHGAFHSGLMQSAQDRLAPYLEKARLQKAATQVVMNVPGDFVNDEEAMRRNLIMQVTQPVKWEQGIRAMERHGIDLYIEFGPGKTLSGMNKRIGVQAPTLSIEKIEDLALIREI
jgi:[acyl-carrier-protein] S-malonyltransferase